MTTSTVIANNGAVPFSVKRQTLFKAERYKKVQGEEIKRTPDTGAPTAAGLESNDKPDLRTFREERRINHNRSQATQRWSFELYDKQIQKIHDSIYAHRKHTGENLSSSAFVRAA